MDLARVAVVVVVPDGSSVEIITTAVDEAWAAPVDLFEGEDTVAIIRMITNRMDQSNRVV